MRNIHTYVIISRLFCSPNAISVYRVNYNAKLDGKARLNVKCGLASFEIKWMNFANSE